jgi:hypothetical protein
MGAKDNQYNYFIMGEKKDNFTKLLKQNKRLDHQYSCSVDWNSVDWNSVDWKREDINLVIKKQKEMNNVYKLVSVKTETNLSVLTESVSSSCN